MIVVVVYTVSDESMGEFADSSTFYRAIESESLEQAKLDFGSKFLEKEAEYEVLEKKTQDWNRRLDSIQKTSEKWMEVYKQRPKEVSSSFVVGGKSFCFQNFLSNYDYKGPRDKAVFIEPQFWTLEEWIKRS